MKEYITALRQACKIVDVPGTPRSLRLEDVQTLDDRVRLSWSFVDPEVLPGDHRSPERRLHGWLDLAPASGVPIERAREWWAAAQLAAARRYALQIDADWTPGEPYVRRVWSRDEAWHALLGYLRTQGRVLVESDQIRVVSGPEEIIYRIDAEEWAAHLTEPDAAEEPAGTDIVPVGTRLVDGLPLWAVDELSEAVGAWGPVVGLRNGRIVGLRSRDY